jgi:hypothetical protein
MRRVLFILLSVVLVGGLSHWSAVQAQPVNVTFILNTATVPDTIPVAGSQIQLRGALVNSGTAPITWGNDSVNNMTNIGGDYWSKTIQLNTDDTLKYKFVVAYASGTGWEQNTTPPYSGLPADNRYFIVGTHSDTTVPVEFWNNGAAGRPQYFRPWDTEPADSISIYFRVNMGGPIARGTYQYQPATDTVGVRGGASQGTGELHWSPTFYLTKESKADNGDGYTVPPSWFWSGRVLIPKDSVTEGEDISYKFIIGYDWTTPGGDQRSEQLDGTKYPGGNRHFTIPVGKKDTTLKWVFFGDETPIGRLNTDTVIVTYRANLARAIQTGGFSIGDTLYVRSGYFGTSTEGGRRKTMERAGGSTYIVIDTVVTKTGETFDYQYYAVKNAQEIRENYYNFFYTGDQSGEAEKRQVIVPGLTFSVYDTATGVAAENRQPVFPNARALAQNVLVKYEVNLKPVFYQIAKGDTLHDIQGSFNIYEGVRDSILNWGVFINGPAVGGWNNPGTSDWDFGLYNNPDKKMFDDGTHGDMVAGDTIFTRDVQCSPDSVSIGSKWQVGQVFKFGVRGGDNEGGSGGFGNNHSENIVDTDTMYTIHSQFGSINPAFYNAWDYNNEQPAGPQGVITDKGLPKTYSLSQNYPNPFNPSTKIEFAIPTSGLVTLRLYNVLGQEVATIVNEKLEVGSYHVTFDASKMPSGVYIYRLTAGNFVSAKKMVLLK